MKELFNALWSKVKTHAIYILIICVLIAILSVSVSRCTDTSREYKHNIEALKDTIKYYQDKNGNLVATKLAFESDVNTLKELNEFLYNQIDSLKLSKGSVTQIIHIGGEIENPEKDTAYVITHDTIAKGFYREFDFNNKYRTLEGNVIYKDDSLGVHITKDIISFDYTLAMDKDSRIYVKSTNPYVKYNEISGFTVPKQRNKRWNIGPAVNVGYDPFKGNVSYSVGVSLTYGIIQW